MKICVNYIVMNIGTPENKSVNIKVFEVQYAAFSGFSCGKPIMLSHIRTKSERNLNAENNFAFKEFSAFRLFGV